jgi:hypothetical protein
MTVGRFFERVRTAVGSYLTADTSALETKLANKTVAIECATEKDRAGWWTTELLVNQLARLYPRLRLLGDPHGVETCAALACGNRPIVNARIGAS